ATISSTSRRRRSPTRSGAPGSTWFAPPRASAHSGRCWPRPQAASPTAATIIHSPRGWPSEATTSSATSNSSGSVTSCTASPSSRAERLELPHQAAGCHLRPERVVVERAGAVAEPLAQGGIGEGPQRLAGEGGSVPGQQAVLSVGELGDADEAVGVGDDAAAEREAADDARAGARRRRVRRQQHVRGEELLLGPV